MDERLIDLNSEICLARVKVICSYFHHHKHWMRLFAMNRRRHPSGGEHFVPYRVDHGGIRYRVADVLDFICREDSHLTLEEAKNVLEFYESADHFDLQNLLHELDAGGATPDSGATEGCHDEDSEFDGCFLLEDDYYDALGVIADVEDGIKRTMDHLIALTKLCEGMAATRAKPDEPTAEYLSSFGWGAINDADKLLFKLQNLASLLDRNCDQYGEEMDEPGECALKEVS